MGETWERRGRGRCLWQDGGIMGLWVDWRGRGVPVLGAQIRSVTRSI